MTAAQGHSETCELLMVKSSIKCTCGHQEAWTAAHTSAATKCLNCGYAESSHDKLGRCIDRDATFHPIQPMERWAEPCERESAAKFESSGVRGPVGEPSRPSSNRAPDTSAAQGQRDPFADDVLERLARSNMDYQREHGNYIVPLAERLLAARAALRSMRDLAMVAHNGDPWYAEQENIDVGAVLDQAEDALGEERRRVRD